MHETSIIQRALLSVYDKENIIPLAESLHLRGVQLISTGNTAALLKEHGLPVTLVGDYTGFPEMMQGRVKTLHPKIHGGILGRRDVDADVMIAHDIPDIDLIVVNLYPFQKVIQKKDILLEEAIENIDIGGPTMLRAAAKNYEWCTVLTSPSDYAAFIDEFNKNGAISSKSRFEYAKKAFAHTAQYDAAIAQFLNHDVQSHQETLFPSNLVLSYTLKDKLRYGENPHQEAAVYQSDPASNEGVVGATMLQGKALSFNNIVDADTAFECVMGFDDPACVIVKHANPCGVAIAASLKEAYDKAFSGDPTSAFGGIIAFNKPVDGNLIEQILKQQFVEVIIAPNFDKKAIESAQQKPNCRLLQTHRSSLEKHPFELKSVSGGLLVQTNPHINVNDSFSVVTTLKPTPEQMKDLKFSWQVVKFLKSNAIVFAKGEQTLGLGVGQMSRIFSTHIASLKASECKFSLHDSVMASDAFFPFIDNIEVAHSLGIKAIIQPGGSKNDTDVIAKANELGIAMVFTGTRFFRH